MSIVASIAIFIPPVIWRAVRRLFRGMKSYASYAEAASKAGSYEQGALIDAVVERGDRLSSTGPQEYVNHITHCRPLLIGLICVGKKTISCLDFGGGAGHHYHLARYLVPDDVRLRWVVVETKTMAAAAKHAQLGNDELSFVGSIEEAHSHISKFDVVFSSCAISYVPEPRLTLEKLLLVPTASWIFTRTPLNKNKNDVYCVQVSRIDDNGVLATDMPSTPPRKLSYPVTILSKQWFEDRLGRAGDVLLKFEEEKDIYVTKTDEHSLYGYIVRPR